MKNSNLLAKAQNIYLIGIKGVGMTALAQILKSRGQKINGSDTEEIFFTDKVLKKLNISFKQGFSPRNLPHKTDLVIYSTAFNANEHPEICAARKRGLAVISYPEALSALFNTELGIAVSGTHGKTTTAALIADSLKKIGLDPLALIGSRVVSWQTNAITGKSPFFVIEADEHQNKLKYYLPWSLIITNIDYDHPDYYRNPNNYYRAFKNWVGKWQTKKSAIPKIGIFNGDDPKTLKIIRENKLKKTDDAIILTYGKGLTNNVRIMGCASSPANKKLSIKQNPIIPKVYSTVVSLNLNVPLYKHNQNVKIKSVLIGEHNAYNLAAAYAFIIGLNLVIAKMSHQFKNQKLEPIPLATITSSLETFRGTERRMQYVGQRERVHIFDDYAHHPVEVAATLGAARKHFAKHDIFVIFHPHTFTRTSTFLKEFAKSLKIANSIGLLPIYGSARESKGNVKSEDLQRILSKTKKNVFNFSSQEDCLNFLKKYRFSKPTILITMGAGDVWRVGKKYLLSKNTKSKNK